MKLNGSTRLLIVVFLFASKAAAVNNCVALLPAEGKFLTVIEEMRKQAGADYNFSIIDMNKAVTINEIITQCKSADVRALILMDAKAIKVALELEKTDSSFKLLPKFALMTLMVESMSRGLSNIAGITFEVPFYTILLNFQIISMKDITKVGIFYRKSYTGFIEESKKQISREGISTFPICVDCDGKQKADPENTLKIMNSSFNGLITDDKIDLFLVPADNLIVNSRSLEVFWINQVKKIKMPLLAPLDLLASEKIGAAIFAADPDLTQLSAQAVSQIVDHFENDRPMNKIGFEPTISIKSILNMQVAREIGWKLKEDKLNRITTIIK